MMIATVRIAILYRQPQPTHQVELRSCRHPVVAAKMGNAFVPNDTLMNSCGVPGAGFYVGFKTWMLDEMGSIWQKR